MPFMIIFGVVVVGLLVFWVYNMGREQGIREERSKYGEVKVKEVKRVEVVNDVE